MTIRAAVIFGAGFLTGVLVTFGAGILIGVKNGD